MSFYLAQHLHFGKHKVTVPFIVKYLNVRLAYVLIYKTFLDVVVKIRPPSYAGW